MPRATSEHPTELELALEGLRDIRVHPDGQRIAFSVSRRMQEIWVMENFLPVSQATR